MRTKKTLRERLVRNRMLTADDGGAGAGAGGAGTAGAAAGGDAGKGVGVTVAAAAEASKAANSASASVSSIGSQPAGDAAQQGAPDFKTSLGEYGKDPAFDVFKDPQSLAKAYKDTKALVGQKLGIPDDKATPEAKAAFYQALGVPDTPEGYALKAPEGLPENIKATYDGQMLATFQAKAKELNLTPAQAKGLQEWNDGMMLELMKGAQTDAGKSDQEFAALSLKTFGTEQKATAALESARTMIEKYAPAELKADTKNMHNTALMTLAAVLAGHNKATSGEDTVIGDGGGDAAARSEADLRQEARDIMTLPEYSSPFAKGKDAHDAARAKLRGIYKQIDSQKMAAAKGKK